MNNWRQPETVPTLSEPVGRSERKLDRILIGGILAALTGLLLLLVWRVIHSRITGDAPIMFYIAFLIDRFHFIPYRDTFDMNMPGSYLLYVLLGKVTDYTDAGIRAAEFFLLLVINLATWFSLRKLGGLVAWSACIIFSLFYLLGGSQLSLQREFLILILISLALAVLFNLRQPASVAGSVLIGLLLGFCVTIKPQVAFVWPLFPLYQAQCLKRAALSAETAGSVRRVWLGSFGGFLLPLLVMFGYLIAVHALSAFLDVAVNYWPLYGAMDGQHRTIAGLARVHSLIVGLLHLCLFQWYTVPALFGLELALRRSILAVEQRRQVKMLACLAVFFFIYPVFSGQFWLYHGLPFFYFSVVLTSLYLVPLDVRSPGASWMPLFQIGVIALLLLSAGRAVHRFQPEVHPKNGRVDQIAAYLAAHLKPGDRVQPLDWGAGAAQAMLEARVQIATPFIYDFYFYHHVSHPYIQNLRRRFIQSMEASKPRFVIQITTEEKPWPSGADTTREFPELQVLLHSEYQPVQQQNGYVLWERKTNG